MTSWCSFSLPCKAWVVLDKDGSMITTPVMHKASAECMAAENVGGTLKKALSQGYRVVQIEMRVYSA